MKVPAKMTAQIICLAMHRAAQDQSRVLSSSNALQMGLVSERRKHPREGKLRTDRRSELRYRLDGKLTPEVTFEGRKLALANVSRNGIMVRATLRTKMPARILITPVGRSPLSAKLVWKREGLVGLEVPIV
ncbi:hypothetical protein GRI89_12580 [Altererythrobacter salegens]|uniref:PilZ domain-containing protein n=1 Tax=Croceibacterium salegens TaxID=1737568 RepID=A0A6I4SWH5_9SPHN|nr:hypothetical protein [Croceibacterium salegens]MXO60375.1 hypothetical protein [Croceibacterium salegens]